MTPWKERVPPGCRAWSCRHCGALCQVEARTDCARTKDRAARCGYLEDDPRWLDIAWPFYVEAP